MRQIRFGVIGCGLMGREFASAAARWLHLLDLDFEPVITAVCDQNPDATAWFENSLNPKPFATGDYRELLTRADVDAVYCAVPHNLHESIYTAIIEAGKHLLAEKPFGIDLPSAERIMDCVRRHPSTFVRCSGQFPFFPAVQRIVRMAREGSFGRILEVQSSFLHSSDLDPNKPMNWKRRAALNGEYGCMGDLGLHVCVVPFRLGWRPKNVRALLTRAFDERPDGKGGMAACETWDNAFLACETVQGFPMILETKRMSPGDMNTWSIKVLGTENSAFFTTKFPKTLRTMPFSPRRPQGWIEEDVGFESCYRTVTGSIFEFGFPDAIQQLWAAYMDELVHGEEMIGSFRCATPEEALESHRLFTAALRSQRGAETVQVE